MSSEFVDSILPDKVPEHVQPARDSFLPWHRVRKEFIRQYQWNDLTRRMIVKQWKRELQRPDDDWSLDDTPPDKPLEVPEKGAQPPRQPVRCLVIPGDDLLDLRALHRDVQE